MEVSGAQGATVQGLKHKVHRKEEREQAKVGVDYSNWVSTSVRVLFAAASDCPRNREGTVRCQVSARHKCGVSEVVYGTGEPASTSGGSLRVVPRMVQTVSPDG